MHTVCLDSGLPAVIVIQNEQTGGETRLLYTLQATYFSSLLKFTVVTWIRKYL